MEAAGTWTPTDQAQWALSCPLDVWFVNVGHGDCTVIRYPDGRVTMIDTCASACLGEQIFDVLAQHAGLGPVATVVRAVSRAGQRSLSAPPLDDPVDVLRSRANAQQIFRLVLTHPDMDHLRGLARLKAAYPILNLWDTWSARLFPRSGFGTDEDSLDWVAYCALRAGQTSTHVLRVQAATCGDYWTGDGIEVLSPSVLETARVNVQQDWNDISYVLRIRWGEASLLLPGDASAAVLERLVLFVGSGLRTAVLKAPHHGRQSGWSGAFVGAVAPRVIVVSSGSKPGEHDAAADYRRHGAVVTTQRHGTIHLRLFGDGRVEARDWLNRPIVLRHRGARRA